MVFDKSEHCSGMEAREGRSLPLLCTEHFFLQSTPTRTNEMHSKDELSVACLQHAVLSQTYVQITSPVDAELFLD